MCKVLIDNATMYSTASIFTRVKSKLKIRPINLLSLSSLIDSLVFFEDIIIDEKALDHWSNEVPIDWIIPIEKIVTAEKITLNRRDYSLESFLSTSENFAALNGVLLSNDKYGIRNDYLAYDGYDFFCDEFREDDRRKIHDILIEEWDWVHNTADSRHIDSVYASWRAVQYANYCSKKKYCYVPHEIRAAFFQLYHFYEDDIGHHEMVKNTVNKIKQRINKKNDTGKEMLEEILPFSKKHYKFWENMKMPIMLPLILRKSSTIYEIFEKTIEYRIKAKPLRKEIINLNENIRSGEFDKAYKILSDLSLVLDNISDTKNTSHLNWSVAGGYPFGLSVTVGGDFKFEKKYISFVRDLYQAKSIPYTFIKDIKKLFPHEFSYWDGLFID